MHRIGPALLCSCLLPALVQADDLFVAPDGDDTGPGTLAAPFRSVERAQQAAAPGDTVYLRGGLYAFAGSERTVGVAFSKSGTAGKPIHYLAYGDERPIFDLFELNPQARVTGLDVHCDWVHLRGLEVRGVRQNVVGDSWGVRVRGDHNVLEQLDVHDNEAPGVFITSGASNLVLNSDSHHNYDPLESGENADGFGCHASGGDNVLRGCRAWENSDDGFDFINAPGTCLVEDSWAFRNGFVPETSRAGGNGGGFKAGGFGNPPRIPSTGVPRHVVRKNVAFGNRAIGFYANHHPGGIDFFNNTAFDNPANFDMRNGGEPSSHKLRNNVAAGSGRALVNFDGGSDRANSWTLALKLSDGDFLSLDHALGRLPRQPDGSLPDVPLAHPSQGSILIDLGEEVGLPFAGAAPDLGAYEWGTAPPVDAGLSPADAAAPPDGASGPPATPLRDAGSTVAARDAASPPPSSGGTEPLDAALDPERGAPAPGAAREGCACGLDAEPPTLGGTLVVLAMCLAARRRSSRAARVARRPSTSDAGPSVRAVVPTPLRRSHRAECAASFAAPRWSRCRARARRSRRRSRSATP